ncbi:MAG TPA: DegT/DnrJ/EryC1/StrS family aminotransferase, partial [Vicinamibacteria bacterium]|nr:DegT/DnrJ/EryC1/StrS family aminotransferase [Vicinamibacteria bacterium]
AALGSVQLARLDEGITRRRRLASLYRRELEGLATVSLPPPEEQVRSTWHLFPVRVRHPKVTRRQAYDALRAQGILVQVHYIPIHLHPYYRQRFGFGPVAFPAAEAFYEEELSLPLFATMSEDDLGRVASALRTLLA